MFIKFIVKLTYTYDNVILIVTIPAIANTVTMQSAKARLMNKVVVLFFLILCPSRVMIERVFPIVDRITKTLTRHQKINL